MEIAPGPGVSSSADEWEQERRNLLGRQISDLELRVAGSRVERLVSRLYDELGLRDLVFRPPVYLSDQWGCPDGTPLIGVPFYLADERLARIEAERSNAIEGETEAMQYMRHEAGHAFNYAYRLYDRADWRQTFGPYSRPYRERYHADPFSRDYVRHVLGWYAQKHPDEDFAESFAVWLTPGLDWRREYAGWPALKKLEYADRVLGEVGSVQPVATAGPTPADLPVDAMHYTVEEHYRELDATLPIGDDRYFDGDLRNLFSSDNDAAATESAESFIRSHGGELVSRIAYWSGESPAVVRAFVDFLAARCEALELRRGSLEASTLIELTAFGTAVMMNYRYTDAIAAPRGGDL